MPMIRLLVFSILFYPLSVFSQDTTLQPRKSTSFSHAPEKLHLHLDKPFYSPGDTIWFKTYLVDWENKLTEHSKVIYIDLINNSGEVIKAIKVPVAAGLSWGDTVLEKGLPAGNYRLRAYTSWMRNYGEEYFFEKLVPVTDIYETQIASKMNFQMVGTQIVARLEYKNLDGTPVVEKNINYSIVDAGTTSFSGKGVTDDQGQIRIPIDTARLARATLTSLLSIDKDTIIRSFRLPTRNADFDVQFFPEGGYLVQEIPSRLGFKVVGADGLGAAATGFITDDDNKRIVSFESEFAGMGMFGLNPQPGKTYTAHVRLTNGIEKKFRLPEAKKQGYVMTVTNDATGVLVRVRASESLKATSVTLVAQSHGKELARSNHVFKDAQIVIRGLKKDFPSGISQMSLYSSEGVPLAERIVFVDHSDELMVRVDSLRDEYAARAKVTPKFVVTNREGTPVIAHLSMSVVDDSKVSYDEREETTILSNLLLTSELKGFVEKPNYYFTDHDEDKKRQLDILMMTQGWRRFALKDNQIKITDPEESLMISGKVLTPFKSPVPGAQVNLMIQSANKSMQQTTTNEYGEFVFKDLDFENTARLTLSAKNGKGNSNVNIVLDTILSPSVKPARYDYEILQRLDSVLISNLDKENIDYLKRYQNLNKTQNLSEVVITATKVKKVPNSANLNGRDAMYTFLENDLLNYNRLSDVVRAKVPAIETRRSATGETVAIMTRKMAASVSGPMLMQVYLDGVPMGNDLDIYNLNDLEAVEVLNRDIDFAAYGTLGAGGVILLTSHTKGPKSSPPMGTIIVNSSGYVANREFYFPKYDDPKVSREIRDVRSTIYWNPDIFVTNGINAGMSFFTAETPGIYRFTIEGIDELGRIVRKVFTKRVNLNPSQVFGKKDSRNANSNSMDSVRTVMREKVHLHLDRPFYSAGDTVWFKAYLVDSDNKPTQNSSVLYVDLLSQTDEVIESLKVPLTAGLGWSSLNLSENLQGGNYRIRAYTNWMRNFSDELFFDKVIPVSDIFESQVISSVKYNYSGNQLVADIQFKDLEDKPLGAKDVKYTVPRGDRKILSGKGQTDLSGRLQIRLDTTQLGSARTIMAGLNIEKDTVYKNFQIPVSTINFDAQFFPEGGELVADIPTRLAFKITGAGGLGLSANGYITDESGTRITDFKSSFGGMGVFDFTPQTGQIYTAHVQVGNGVAKQIPLPKSIGKGLIMTVTEDEKNIIATVKGSVNSSSVGSVRLLATSGERVRFDTQKEVDGFTWLVNIPKADLPAGITRLTLLREGKNPVAERIVFVNQNEQLSIGLNSMEDSYETTAKVNLELTASTTLGKPTTSHLSIAVVDDDKVPYDELEETTIFSNLLLSSELKGYIEKPNYYFTDVTDEKKRQLDNLMLTQGWRKIELRKNDLSLKFAREAGISVKGKVLTPFKLPVANAPVRLLIQREGEVFHSTTTNANGEFVFDSLNFEKRAKLILSASNVNGRSNVAIKIDSVSTVAEVRPLVYQRPNLLTDVDSAILARKEDVYRDQIRQRVNLNKVQQLAEVTVRASRAKPYSTALMYPVPFTYTNKVLSKYETLPLAITSEGVPGVRIDVTGIPMYMYEGNWLPMSIVLDGIEIDVFEFGSLETTDIEAIEVVARNKALMSSGTSLSGLIFITSRKGGSKTKSPQLGQIHYFAQGFQPERQFYSPKYDDPDKAVPASDLRTTIYWKPDIFTIGARSTDLSFFTAAKPGKYRFIIEGVDADGRLGRKVFVREVK